MMSGDSFAVTCDVILMDQGPDGRRLLLIRRRNPPFAGMWALPGGHLDHGEDLIDCAGRELMEETGVAGVALRQVGAFGRPSRDRRGPVVSVAFAGLVPPGDAPAVQAADDAAEAAWFPLAALPPLAFDHAEMITAAQLLLDR